jgi:AraC-like DNA-binding protein
MRYTEISSASAWSRACSRAFVPLTVHRTAADFTAQLSQTEVIPGVSVATVCSAASDVIREPRLVRDTPRDDILLSVHRTGSGSVRQHGRTARLGPGNAVLYDASSPYLLSFPGRMSETVLQVSRGTLPAAGNSFNDMTANTLPSGASLRALAALLGTVDVEDTEAEGSTGGEALADSLVTLLLDVLSAPDAVTTPPLESSQLLIALKLHADTTCTDPDLTPTSLAAEFHVSLRQVQKLFARDGESPAEYIRRRRLEHAALLLCPGTAVARAAHDSGFHDVDTFSRAFTRHYGVVPSQYRDRDL